MTMNNMPRRLPIVTVNGKKYFLDERLRQLRNVSNPSDYINLPREGESCATNLKYGVDFLPETTNS